MNDSSNKPACLFCVSSLGLGHATRTLAVIKNYLSSHQVHVLSTGKALDFLKDELRENGVVFHDFTDYPPLERGKGAMFYAYLVADSLKTTRIIKRENKFVSKLCEKIHPEFIISDGRYGSYVKGIPSFIISHQISFVLPRGFGAFKPLADYFNFKTFSKFDSVFIPDYEDPSVNLGGKLSHDPMLRKLSHRYVGILSSLKKEVKEKDIDYLFTLSGYLDEHKGSFVSLLVEKAKKLSGKKVFILGNTNDSSHQFLPDENIEIYSVAIGKLRNDLFNRSKFVISRSGYTTIMDLVELGLSGYLVPTPGQTEQEYLASYLGEKEYFLCAGAESGLNLAGIKENPISFSASWVTERSVSIIDETIKASIRA